MTETEPIVRVSGVSHAFGDREVLHGVDVDVSPGELLGVVGPNGAGKTTLIRLMQGLLRPAVGSVTTFGAAAWPPDRVRNGRIGVQPQDPALFEQLTVREQLRLFVRLRGADDAEASRAATTLGLDDCLGVRLERLSGGQRQRLSVACALVGAPELLFLDEPTANVDPIARRRMRTVLREVVSRGAAMVYTSHDLNEVGDLCDRVVVLARGRVLAEGTPGELEKRSGLKTLEVHADDLLAVGDLDLDEVVGAELDGDVLILVSRDAAHTFDAVRRVAPDARITVRSEPFEDLYVRLVTRAEERSAEQ